MRKINTVAAANEPNALEYFLNVIFSFASYRILDNGDITCYNDI